MPKLIPARGPACAYCGQPLAQAGKPAHIPVWHVITGTQDCYPWRIGYPDFVGEDRRGRAVLPQRASNPGGYLGERERDNIYYGAHGGVVLYYSESPGPKGWYLLRHATAAQVRYQLARNEMNDRLGFAARYGRWDLITSEDRATWGIIPHSGLPPWLDDGRRVKVDTQWETQEAYDLGGVMPQGWAVRWADGGHLDCLPGYSLEGLMRSLSRGGRTVAEVTGPDGEVHGAAEVATLARAGELR